MSSRYVHAIWCDDIRQEIGNKPSFMGVYVGGMTVGSLPVMLPRLAVYLWINTPLDKPLKKISFRIMRDDGFKLAELTSIDIPDIKEAKHINNRCDLSRSSITAGLTLNNVEIPEGCKYFSILVDTESETLDGSKLHIDINPEALAQMNSVGLPPPTPP